MTRVITFGSFDLLHVGHVRLLRRAAEQGDHLTVGVSSNALSTAKKEHPPVYDLKQRMEMVGALAFVDTVFVEESLEQKREYLQQHAADILVMGDDWEGAFDDLGDLCEVRYLPRTKGISTRQTKNTIVQHALVEQILLRPKEASTLYEMIEDVDRLLTEKYQVSYFAIGGTMLGAYRNKGLIAWDDDIDIAVLKDAIPVLRSREFQADVTERGYAFEDIKFTCFKVKKQGLTLDIFPFEKEHDGTYTFVYGKDIWPKRRVAEDDLFPLKRYPFGPTTILGMNNPHPFFVNCGFGDYMKFGVVGMSYHHSRRQHIIRLLWELGLPIIRDPRFLYKRVSPPPPD